jgi:carbamoyltransferase
MQMKKPKIILGIHPWHDASVSFVDGERTLFSIAEERLSRIKHHYGFPILGIREGMRRLDINYKDIAAIAISTKKPILPHPRQYIILISGEVKKLGSPKKKIDWFWPEKRNVARGKVKIPRDWVGEFEDRHWSYHYESLVELGLMNARIPIFNVEHHKAHSAAAFRSKSWNSDVCVITFDGKGDNLSHSTILGNSRGDAIALRTSSSANSLGAFYQAVTESLGFIPVDGEYKTMGLAALGSPLEANPFADVLRVIDGELQSKYNWEYRSFNKTNPERKVNNPLSSVSQTEIFKDYLEQISPENFAFAAQSKFEEIALDLVGQSLALTGARNLAISGGCALNVKANKKIINQFDVDEFYVFPDAGDSGNATGAALEAHYFLFGTQSINLDNMYLGTDYSDSQIQEYLSSHGIVFTNISHNPEEAIVSRLVQGQVVGVFWGPMEVGPRALGNRSVLADPRHTKVKDRINEILKGREWFVPFAPILLKEDKELYYDSKLNLNHMTIAVNASNYAKENSPNVVHFDGTMRPQEVTFTSNSRLYLLLQEFKKQTGIAVLMNTSFNRHGLPIVESPSDALEHLDNGWVDVLVLGNFLVEKQNQ